MITIEKRGEIAASLALLAMTAFKREILKQVSRNEFGTGRMTRQRDPETSSLNRVQVKQKAAKRPPQIQAPGPSLLLPGHDVHQGLHDPGVELLSGTDAEFL